MGRLDDGKHEGDQCCHDVIQRQRVVAVLSAAKERGLRTGENPAIWRGHLDALLPTISNMAMLELLRGMRQGLAVHGFRSTFRDWAAEATAYPAEVVEMALAHSIRNEVEAAYRRGDLLEKPRDLMRAWAAYLA